jgi:hypothetical protein
MPLHSFSTVAGRLFHPMRAIKAADMTADFFA